MSRHAVARDSLLVAASQFLARAVLLARGWAAAAALGPHGFGGWNALNLIFDYGAYASLGALQGLDLELPAAARGGNAPRARRLMGGALTAVVAGGAIFAAALAGYLASGGHAFSTWPGVRLPALMLVAALLQLGFQYLAAALRAHGRFGAVSAGVALQSLLGGGLGLVLVWNMGALGLLLGWNAGTLVSLAWMRRAIPEAPLTPGSPAVGRDLTRLGLPIFAYFATTLLLRSVDRLALVRFGGEEPLGLYALALMVAGVALYPTESAAYVIFPRIAASLHGGGDRESARAETLKAQRALTLMMPLAIGLGLCWVKPVVAWLLPDYREAHQAILVLGVAAMMFSAATLPGYYLLAARRNTRLLVIGITAAAVTAVLTFSAAARDPDPRDVAMAALAGQSLFAVAVIVAAAVEWFDRPIERVRATLGAVLPAAWGGALTIVVAHLHVGEPVATAAVQTAALAAGYAPLLLWLGRGSRLFEVLCGPFARILPRARHE